MRTPSAQNIKIFRDCSADRQQWGREAAFAAEQLPADWRDGAEPGTVTGMVQRGSLWGLDGCLRAEQRA